MDKQFEVTVNLVNSGDNAVKLVAVTLTVFKEAPPELKDKTSSVILKKVQAFGTGSTIEKAEEQALKRAKKRLELI